jgi:hypothetical protein
MLLKSRNGEGVRRTSERLTIRLTASQRPLYIAVLRFVNDHLRRRFAHFDVRTHLLDLRCLLVQARRHSFHSFLLLCHSRLEVFALLGHRCL